MGPAPRAPSRGLRTDCHISKLASGLLGRGRMGFSWLNLQSLFGLIVITAICWVLSENRRKFPWRLVMGASLLQAAIVLVLFAAPGAGYVLTAFSDAVDGLTNASK